GAGGARGGLAPRSDAGSVRRGRAARRPPRSCSGAGRGLSFSDRRSPPRLPPPRNSVSARTGADDHRMSTHHPQSPGLQERYAVLLDIARRLAATRRPEELYVAIYEQTSRVLETT